MELRQFIATTLIDVARGVDDAKKVYADLGGVVNPEEAWPLYPNSNKRHCDVSFDVALAEASGTGSSKGIGVLLSVISAHGVKSSEDRIEALTNIKFTIPVVLP